MCLISRSVVAFCGCGQQKGIPKNPLDQINRCAKLERANGIHRFMRVGFLFRCILTYCLTVAD